MQRIPLFGTGLLSNSAVISRQRRLNMMAEIRTDGDKENLVFRTTPGMEIKLTLPAQPIRGWHVAAGKLYVVAGLSLIEIDTSLAMTIRGTFPVTSTGLVDMADNGIEVVIVDGVAGYFYTIATTTLATITDGNFPNGTNSICFLDGRIIAAKPNTRQFYCSEQYAASNWTNVSSLPTFGTKDNYSDNLVAVAAQNGVLVLFGESSTEFWQNVGTTPLPFGRIPGATRTLGLAARYSIANVGDKMFFAAVNLHGGYVEVMMLQGFNMTRVSNNDIEHIIGNLSLTTRFTDGIGFGYLIDGHENYQLTFPSGMKSLVFDSSTGFWSEVQSGVGLTGRHNANLCVTFNSVQYVSDTTSANMYRFDEEIYTDNGEQIKRQLTTRHVQQSGNVFGIDELYLDVETGVGTQYGDGADPKIMLQVSKDGGRTFGAERWVSFGKVGQYRTPRAIWNRLGSARDFVFQFTMTEPVKFVVIGGSVKIRQLEGRAG